MFPPIFTYVAASNAVKALIGSSPVRFYPFADAPQTVTKPYAVWQTVAGSPENYLGQVPDTDSYTTQIDVYSQASATQCRDIARAIRDAIEPHCHITRWGAEEREADTMLYRISFDAEWFVYR